MDAPATATQIAHSERDHLARVHHEICTALTIFNSNVELVRTQLGGTMLPENGVRVRAHLDEMGIAVARLRDMANEMKQWYDAAPSGSALASGQPGDDGRPEPGEQVAGEQGTLPARPPA